jgi:hypothetical protein
MLQEQVAQGSRIAVTSFRKGGPNAKHELLHRVKSCLALWPPATDHPVGYVHFQSGFENSLFGWKNGSGECAYGVEKYFGLNMKQYW